MKSPFPGMDPYLEANWGDVHASLITYCRDALQRRLPRDLRARIEERVFVEDPEADERRVIYPDIRVIEHGLSHRPDAPAVAGGAAVAEPLVIHCEAEPRRQGYIEIIEVGTGRRVLTVIEVLSPANKFPGEGQDLYLRKQTEVKAGGVSLVEIDLVRAGGWVLAAPVARIPEAQRTPYAVSVHRGWRPCEYEYYPVPLRAPLPTIRVPLRRTDEDVTLELQALIDQCYENGRYGEDLDYKAEPRPPLNPDDAAWADALLRKAGRR